MSKIKYAFVKEPREDKPGTLGSITSKQQVETGWVQQLWE
jgi:hypothetical protein